jgi:acyl-CoA reductase-like NAD-dependent aldehyde dehydrogenase
MNIFISPVVISKDVDITTTARRIMWGKTFNAGQTCIAPDYVLCEREIQQPLVDAMKAALQEWHQEADLRKSKDYGRIVNANHFRRLKKLLDETNGEIVIGGKLDEDDLYISPTVVINVAKNDKVCIMAICCMTRRKGLLTLSCPVNGRGNFWAYSSNPSG